MQTRENKFYDRVQLFIKNLDAAKQQVSEAMGHKDLALSKLTSQLKNKNILFSYMRKELHSKSAQIKNLKSIIAKNDLKQNLIA